MDLRLRLPRVGRRADDYEGIEMLVGAELIDAEAPSLPLIG
jgi:hypothetical protein